MVLFLSWVFFFFDLSNLKFALLGTLFAVSHPTDSHSMFLNFLDELTIIFPQNILWNFMNFSHTCS